VAYEIVPGVTAALAAAAELRTSLTQRGAARSVAFVTPRVGAGEDPSSWVAALAAADTGVVYMGAGQAATIAAALLAAGKPAATPVALVESASARDARRVYTTLGGLPRAAEALGGGPAIIIVGDVTRARAARGAAEAPNNLPAADERCRRPRAKGGG
jgi:uroporphyrin-III C-methyltransferase